MRLSDENLRGRTVIAADGQAVGEIAALFLDSETWRVESLQINLRKEIADLLELPVRLIQSVGDTSVGDTIVLSVPALALRKVLPGLADESAAH